jgi:agmatinase
MAFDPNAAASPDSGLYGLTSTVEDAKVVVIEAPWDATTSYRAGTANGPQAVLEASKQVDLFDLETGRPYEAGIALLEAPDDVRGMNAHARALAEPIILAGGAGEAHAEDLAEVNALSARLNDWVHGHATTLLERGKLVALLGGDHSTPFGLIRAVSERHAGVGVLHLDAHADLREAYEGFTDSHASIMFNVMERLPGVGKLVQVGLRDFGEAEHDYAQKHARIVQFHDATMAARRARGASWISICDEIIGALPMEVYLSFDIDGLDPTHCPHTGTPVPGGLTFQEVNVLLSVLVESGRKVVGLDLNEVAPGPDPERDGEWDANVGARLLYKMIGWALKTR